ncbi:transposase [Mesorhizobium sp. VK22B]|uniref:Transposase n=1 Tax=Mesorhizobium captivum TaxID=3072319 RepID=A0ABU4ZE11_9HYPH|nr:transposase [Mesorhizobium sp. VK22B]MDX8496505.1 transposase [Mesorhizobium sp. VK22B]
MARPVHDSSGVSTMITLSVASTFDDASRVRRTCSTGAHLGLTPGRYESGAVNSKRKHLKRGR